jgi:small GTP-binding protein
VDLILNPGKTAKAIPVTYRRRLPLFPMSCCEFKVVIIGAVAVGKTAITSRLQYAQFDDDYQPTIGAGYIAHRTKCEGRDVELQIWDTAGMERYRSLGPIYYRDAAAAVIVYDVTEPESSEAISKWLEAFRGTVKDSAVIIIVGNKSDLPPVVESAPLRTWAQNNHFGFFITSAKTGDGVTEVFEYLVKQLMSTEKVQAVPVQSLPASGESPLGLSCC